MLKTALLIGVSEYTDANFKPLPTSSRDVRALEKALKQTQDGFDNSNVKELINPTVQQMRQAIERLFSNCKSDDLILLYFSGHGITDIKGNLYLSASETQKDLLKSTGVEASFIQTLMSESLSEQQIVILDCCFSGAFAKGMPVKEGGMKVDIRNQLGGKGRVVLTSSTSTQFSFGQPGDNLSVYTGCLIQGIETGEADIDGDGCISIDELHEYAKSEVKGIAPSMEPQIYPAKEGYKIAFVKTPIHDPKQQYKKELEFWAKKRSGKFSDKILLRAFEEKRRAREIEPEEATRIRDEVLKPYRALEERLRKYENAFLEAIQKGYPLSDEKQESLAYFRRALELTDEDVSLIEHQALLKSQTDTTELQLLHSSESTAILTNAEDFFQQGVIKKKKDKQGAIDNFSKAIHLKPDFANAYIKRGEISLEINDFQGALQDYNQAIQLKSDSSCAYLGRAAAYLSLENIQAALEDCSQAIKIDSNWEDDNITLAYCLQCYIYVHLEDEKEAIKALNQAIQFEAATANTYAFRGFLRFIVIQDWQGALSDSNKAFESKVNTTYNDTLDEQFATYAYLTRGVVRLVNEQNFQGAIEDLTQAIQLDLDSSSNSFLYYLYYWRSRVYGALEDYQSALDDLNQASQQKNEDSDLYCDRALTHFSIGDYQKTIDDSNKAIKLDPSNANAYLIRGKALAELQDLQGALENFNQAIIINPENDSYFSYRGIIHATV